MPGSGAGVYIGSPDDVKSLDTPDPTPPEIQSFNVDTDGVTWTLTLDQGNCFRNVSASISATGSYSGSIALTPTGDDGRVFSFTGSPQVLLSETVTFDMEEGAFVSNGSALTSEAVSGGAVTNDSQKLRIGNLRTVPGQDSNLEITLVDGTTSSSASACVSGPFSGSIAGGSNIDPYTFNAPDSTFSALFNIVLADNATFYQGDTLTLTIADGVFQRVSGGTFNITNNSVTPVPSLVSAVMDDGNHITLTFNTPVKLLDVSATITARDAFDNTNSGSTSGGTDSTTWVFNMDNDVVGDINVDVPLGMFRDVQAISGFLLFGP